MKPFAPKNNLQEWLVSYYSTSSDTPPQTIETLMKLCGSQLARLRDFRRSLHVALDALLERGVVLSWTIDSSDCVHVVFPVGSQDTPPA